MVDTDRLRFASRRCHELARATADIPELVPVILTWNKGEPTEAETTHTISELFGRVARLIDEGLEA